MVEHERTPQPKEKEGLLGRSGSALLSHFLWQLPSLSFATTVPLWLSVFARMSQDSLDTSPDPPNT